MSAAASALPAAPASLAALLSHPAIWRGGECAPEPAALATGFAALDAVLPGRGWPGAALTEIAIAREGIGELSLMLPALARLTRERRDIVWVAPPHLPYAPALVAAGIDPRGSSSSARARPPTCCGRTSRRCARPNAAPRSPGRPCTTNDCCAASPWPRARAAPGACCGGGRASG